LRLGADLVDLFFPAVLFADALAAVRRPRAFADFAAVLFFAPFLVLFFAPFFAADFFVALLALRFPAFAAVPFFAALVAFVDARLFRF
jgi:hypothetical protein